MDWSKIKEDCPEIQWRFNPPGSLHFGGVWERAVRQFKQAFYSVTGSHTLGDEEFRTAVAVAEGLVNSRPLSYLTNEAGEHEVLTPNHFINRVLFKRLAPLPADWPFNQRYAAI